MANRFENFKTALAVFFLLITAGLFSDNRLFAQDIDRQKINVGILSTSSFTTFRLQSFSGNWKVEMHPHIASTPSRLPPATEIIRETLIEGEDLSVMLIKKGMTARFSTGKDLDSGFGKIILTGGDLLNIEIPDQQPILLQGRLEIDFNELTIRLANEVSFHQYIVSSVSKLASMTNEPEALKAIIVMTRTRLKFLKENKTHPETAYEICDSDHCLPFQGCGYNRELVDLLVTMTKNQTLSFKGKTIFPRYQNTCGGKISSAKDVFGIDEPYHRLQADLLDGKGSENCFHSPNFHWSIELQKMDILEFLALTYAGGAERLFTSWEPEKIDANGRIIQVFLKGRKPRSVIGHEFFNALRRHFGINGIKSTCFNMELLRRTIIFRGMGHGEGVGMCLYGTDGLAKKNQKYGDILKFYYPGVDIK